jgi:hypothetical protein
MRRDTVAKRAGGVKSSKANSLRSAPGRLPANRDRGSEAGTDGSVGRHSQVGSPPVTLTLRNTWAIVRSVTGATARPTQQPAGQTRLTQQLRPEPRRAELELSARAETAIDSITTVAATATRATRISLARSFIAGPWPDFPELHTSLVYAGNPIRTIAAPRVLVVECWAEL